MKLSRKVLFLPFVGEFGLYVLWYTRAIHLFDAEFKIVCCRHGDECLFPSASVFYYDWRCEFPDQATNGVRSVVESVREMILDGVRGRYGDVEVVDLIDMPNHSQEYLSWASFKKSDENKKAMLECTLLVKVPDRGLSVDVVVTARRRDHHPFRNYEHWQSIVNHLKSIGMTVGLVGRSDRSQVLEGVDVCSWQHGGEDVCIEMLRKARLMVTTDTGPAHLNVLVNGAPMLVIRHPDWIGESITLTSNSSVPTVLMPREGWNDVSVVIKFINQALGFPGLK